MLAVNPMTAKHLAERLHLIVPSVQRSLYTMMERGFVSRDLADESYVYSLTPSGRDFVRETKDAVVHAQGHITDFILEEIRNEGRLVSPTELSRKYAKLYPRTKPINPNSFCGIMHKLRKQGRLVVDETSCAPGDPPILTAREYSVLHTAMRIYAFLKTEIPESSHSVLPDLVKRGCLSETKLQTAEVYGITATGILALRQTVREGKYGSIYDFVSDLFTDNKSDLWRTRDVMNRFRSLYKDSNIPKKKFENVIAYLAQKGTIRRWDRGVYQWAGNQ